MQGVWWGYNPDAYQFYRLPDGITEIKMSRLWWAGYIQGFLRMRLKESWELSQMEEEE